MKYFPYKLLGHEIFRPIVSWAMVFFFEKLLKPSAAPLAYLQNKYNHLQKSIELSIPLK